MELFKVLVAIILAGGFGTRLKNKINNIPKPMIPINGKPFLDYVFDQLIRNGIKTVIMSIYYKSEIIVERYGAFFNSLEIIYSIDNAPLGTGGAVREALKKVNDKNVFVINGDTFFDINLNELMENHINDNNDITLSLKSMKNFDRYGYVKTTHTGEIKSFEEKKYQSTGKIDGGIYVIKKDLFNNKQSNDFFLLTDYIKSHLIKQKIGSITYDSTFIDIGTPEDLIKAESLLNNY